jgi:hypothetical protein
MRPVAEFEDAIVTDGARRAVRGPGCLVALAGILDRWNRDHPDPYLGHHWPATD